MKNPARNNQVIARRAAKLILGAAAALTISVLQTPAQAQQLTSYNDSVGGEHAVYVGTDGHVHQTYCLPPPSLPCNSEYNWNNQDLTIMSGLPVALTYFSRLASFADSSGEHVFVTDGQNNLYQLFYSKAANSWTNKPLGVKSVGGMNVYSTSAFDYLFYETSDQHIHLLQSSNGFASSVDQDWTADSGGPLAEFGTNITSTDPSHAFYLGTNQHIYSIAESEQLYKYEVCRPWFGCYWNYYYYPIWSSLDLTTQSHGPLAVNSLTSLSDATGNDVFYVGNDGHIHELQSGSSGWTDQDVTIAYRAILPYFNAGISGLTTLSNPLGRQLFFIGTDWNVHHLTLIGIPSDSDWTKLAYGPVVNPCNGLVLTSFTNSMPGRVESDVFYVGNDGGVHKLYQVGIEYTTPYTYWWPELMPDMNLTPYSFDAQPNNFCFQ